MFIGEAFNRRRRRRKENSGRLGQMQQQGRGPRKHEVCPRNHKWMWLMLPGVGGQRGRAVGTELENTIKPDERQ